jgi:hypothetical protein
VLRAASVAALAAALVLVAPAQAAAPNYILVSGPGLAKPVLLADWWENHALLLAAANAPEASDRVFRGLARRPKLDLALFWYWSDRPRPTRPSQANQHGSFYPAHGSQPAVIDDELAPVRVLRIFRRHGIPDAALTSPASPSGPVARVGLQLRGEARA